MPLIAIFLVIWLTVARHEGAHALVAWLQGVPIHTVRLFPGYSEELGFYFGYVSRGDGGSWLIDAAPFVAAVLWFSVFYFAMRHFSQQSRWWRPLFLIGLISPLADLLYNYQGGLWREGTDVWDLFQELPELAVHAYFLCAIALLIGGIARFRSSAVRLNEN